MIALSGFEQVLRGRAQVSVASIGSVHGVAIRSADFGQGATQQRAACVQHPPVGFGKRRAGEIERGAGCIFKTQASQIVGDEGSLLELLARGGEPVAHFSELEEDAVQGKYSQNDYRRRLAPFSLPFASK